MDSFIVFDNGGKTFDRFTILNKETGEIYGCGENPFAQDSCCRLLGNCAYRQITLYGSGWREKMPGKKVIKSEVDNFIINAKLNPEWIGRPVEFQSLPENVKQYICKIQAGQGNSSQDFPPLKRIG
jgi:hypothetical protein